MEKFMQKRRDSKKSLPGILSAKLMNFYHNYSFLFCPISVSGYTFY